MLWQDFVFTAGGFVLSAGLVPMLRAQAKPPIRSSATLVVVLASYAIALATLGLWLSAISTVLQAVLWLTLLTQATARRLPVPVRRDGGANIDHEARPRTGS